MKKEILSYILGDLSLSFIVAFYLFALFGVILSMLLHFKKTKRKFSWKFWMNDNWIRFATSFMSIFVVVRFYSELNIEYELNMFLGLLVGLTLDRVIIFIRNKTSIEIFQSKTKTKP